MSSEITVPELGESIMDATVGSWLKRPGDTVAVGDPLVELETEKVNMEIAATASGTLESILKEVGETVAIGEVLGIIGDQGGTETGEPTAVNASQQSAESPQASPSQASSAATAPDPTSAPGVSATPIARRMASEHGIDLARIPTGSGVHGQITQQDVTAYMSGTSNGFQAAGRVVLATPESPSSSPPESEIRAPLGRPEERVRLSRRRQTIARRLVEAQHNAAMLTTFNEVDMSAVLELRKRYRERFKDRYGIGLGFMSFFTRAVTLALKEYPRLNASIEGDMMTLKRYYDIGIAVGVDEGLVVPVLRDADTMSFAEIERRIADLAARAHSNTLTLEELQGGTFTITNGGTFGSLLSTPILNPPQVGILGMHKIEERPVAVSGQLAIHAMMYVALSYDHRIVDGSEAVRFLVRVKELIEDPGSMLLES